MTQLFLVCARPLKPTMLRACTFSLVLWMAAVQAHPPIYVNSANRCWVTVSTVLLTLTPTVPCIYIC